MSQARREFLENVVGVSAETVIPSEMPASKLAEFLDVDTRTINVLADKGVLRRQTNGKFDTTESTRIYVQFSKRSRGNADLESAKVRVAEETAAKLEMQNAVARGDMLPSDAVQREWESILRDLRAALIAVPSRVGTRLPGLSAHDIAEIDAEIRSTLETLAGDQS